MIGILGEVNTLAVVGFGGGLALGLAARLGRFCTLGAIEDYLYSSDDRRLRMWLIATAVAIVATQSLIALGGLTPTDSSLLTIAWNPMATVLGGLAFGYGMALSGNCGYGALARLGGGDLRAFVIVFVMALSAAVVLSGPLALLRVWAFPVEEAFAPQGFGTLAERWLGISPAALGLLLGAGLLALALSSRDMRHSPARIFWAAIVGLAVASGWAGTAWVAQVGFAAEPVQSHSFAAPLAETLFWGMTASGTELSFAVGSVLGVLAGAFLGSLRLGHFRWEACDDPRELRRQMLGAALMGAGAVVAMGCSIGQGLTAVSLLTYSGPVAVLAIFAGAALGLRQLIEGVMPAE